MFLLIPQAKEKNMFFRLLIIFLTVQGCSDKQKIICWKELKSGIWFDICEKVPKR